MKCFLFLISILTVLLSGCSGAERAALNHADALMEERPDSALRILQRIVPSNLGRRDLAYYALLMTQAMVKNDIPVVSDSLIAIAYDKYGDDWRGDRGIRSNFYMGEILFNQEKNRESMRYYLTAYEESKRLGNDYWHAKAAERIADLFFIAYNYPEAARYRKDAIEYFGKADRLTNQKYSIADLATDYMNDSRFYEAIALLDSLYKVSVTDNRTDSFLLDYILRGKVNALAFLGKYQELSEEDLEILDRHKLSVQIIDGVLLKLRFPALNSDSLSETEIVNTLHAEAQTIEDKVLIYYTIYQHDKSNNKNIATQTVDSLIFYQNAIAQNIIKESVTAAERDYYLLSSEKSHQKMIISITISIFIIVIICIISLLLWRFYKFREKIRIAERDANIEALVIMKTKSERLETERELLRKKAAFEKVEWDTVVSHLFKERWSTLSMLCEEYFEKVSSLKLRESIQKKIEYEVRNIGSHESLHQIEEETDRYMDGIVSKLRKECPELKEYEIHFCTLIFAGFSVRAICFILDITTNNFYVRKKRILEKLKKSESPYMNLFIQNLK